MNKRQSNVELLRIICMLGVVTLHYNNSSYSGGGIGVAAGINHVLLIILESMCISAVNIYVMISGYFLSQSNARSLKQPLSMLIQWIVLREICYFMEILSGVSGFSALGMLRILLPNVWFLMLYITMYFLSPILNLAMKQLTHGTVTMFVIAVVIIFSLEPTLIDVFNCITGNDWTCLSTVGLYGSQKGYSIVNFFMMYAIGSYIRFNWESIKNMMGIRSLTVIYLSISALITLWSRYDTGTAWAYCNPLVVMQAVIVFIAFLKTDLGTVDFINKFARGTFTCFVVHTFLLKFSNAKIFCSGSLGVMAIHLFGTVIGIYFVSYLICKVYSVIWSKTLGRWMVKCKLTISYDIR